MFTILFTTFKNPKSANNQCDPPFFTFTGSSIVSTLKGSPLDSRPAMRSTSSEAMEMYLRPLSWAGRQELLLQSISITKAPLPLHPRLSHDHSGDNGNVENILTRHGNMIEKNIFYLLQYIYLYKNKLYIYALYIYTLYV